MPTIYSHYVNDVEVIRGRNSLYNELMLKSENHVKCNAGIGFMMHKLGRMMSRTEIATRVS